MWVGQGVGHLPSSLNNSEFRLLSRDKGRRDGWTEVGIVSTEARMLVVLRSETPSFVVSPVRLRFVHRLAVLNFGKTFANRLA